MRSVMFGVLSVACLIGIVVGSDAWRDRLHAQQPAAHPQGELIALNSDVEEGRQHLNFSEWDQPNEDIDHIVRQIEEGDMPLPGYVLMHGTANLSEAEQQALITGLQATLAQDPPVEGRRGERD